jgi:acyl carrier protein
MRVDGTGILAEITAMLHAIRDDLDTDMDITMDTTFRGDLGIESIDIVALAGRLQARYGGSVNFALFIAGLGVEAISDLRVGTLVDFIAGELTAQEQVQEQEDNEGQHQDPAGDRDRGPVLERAAAEAMAP